MRTDEETGQTIIRGMGELHLEVIVDRLLREFKVEANVGKPQVAYRETIRKKVTQGASSFGSREAAASTATLSWISSRTSPERVLSSSTRSLAVWCPRSTSRCRQAGIEEALQSGVLAGYPVVDVKVTLHDGSYHEVDSSEMAFKVAGSMGFKEGARKETRSFWSR